MKFAWIFHKYDNTMSNGQTIFHVALADNGEHHYFGSISAIFDVFTPDELGVGKERLWAFGITPEHPYSNAKVTIRKGMLHRKKTNRKLPTL